MKNKRSCDNLRNTGKSSSVVIINANSLARRSQSHYDDNNNNNLDQKCAYISSGSAHFAEYAHYKMGRKRQPHQHHHHRYIQKEKILAAARKKFFTYGSGLTYNDVRREHRLTKKQAQTLLRHHQCKGNLYTCFRKKPQQYFASKEEADLYYANDQRCEHFDPTGVVGAGAMASSHQHNNNKRNTSLPSSCPARNDDNNYSTDRQRKGEEEEEEEKEEEDLKVNDVASTMAAIHGGSIPAGAHNIHLYVTLNPNYASETYHLRLADFTADPNNNNAKLLERYLDDGYLVQCYVYPSGAVDIYIPCSNHPFPIDIDDEHLTGAKFIALLSQIRAFLQWCVADPKGVIVPSLFSRGDKSSPSSPSSSCWRFLQADINFDVPCTAQKFSITSDIQSVKFTDIFRVYRRLREGDNRPVVRVEQMKVFNTHLSDTEEEEKEEEQLGSLIVSAAKLMPKKLISSLKVEETA